jgi:hypothetical protein
MPSSAVPISNIPLTQSGVQNPPSYSQYEVSLDGTNAVTIPVETNQRWWIIGMAKADGVATNVVFKSAANTLHTMVFASGEKLGLPVGGGVLLAGELDESLVVSSSVATDFILCIYIDHYPPFY